METDKSEFCVSTTAEITTGTVPIDEFVAERTLQAYFPVFDSNDYTKTDETATVGLTPA